MNKQELETLYQTFKELHGNQLPKYLELLNYYFPCRKDCNTITLEILANNDSIENPKSSYTVYVLFRDYLNGTKMWRSTDDLNFVEDFRRTLSILGSLDYAFSSNSLYQYIDSKMLKFSSEDIVITDPCYILSDDQWAYSGFGDNLDLYGVDNYVTHSTLYGDWSCTVYAYKLEVGIEVIGHFSADAGLVSVLSLKDIKEKLNPNFEQWAKEHDWCVTIIRNFTGVVQINVDYDKEFYAYVKGSGSVNFVSEQTGF